MSTPGTDSLIDKAIASVTRTYVEANFGPGEWSGPNFVCKSPMPGDGSVAFRIKADGSWLRGVGGAGNSGSIVDLVAKRDKLTREAAAAVVLGLDPKAYKATKRGKIKAVVPVPKDKLAGLSALVKTEAVRQVHGLAVSGHTYRRPDGEAVFCVSRFVREDNGQSETVPYFLGEDDAWHEGEALEMGRPLLYADLITTSTVPVIIVADEFAAGQKVEGYQLTTCHGDVTKTDWATLDTRDVTVWTPPKMASQIKARLPHASVLDLTGYPEDWDVSHAIAEGRDLVAFLAKCPRVDIPSGPNTRPDEGLPFQCLGYDKAAYYFMPRNTRVVIQIQLGTFRTPQMLELANLGWWSAQNLVTDATAIKQAAAQDYLLGIQHKVGMFDPGIVRGAGVWRDADGLVLNDGKRIVTMDRQALPYDEFKSRFCYVPSQVGFGEMHGAQSTDEDGKALERLFMAQEFRTRSHAIALMGWCLMACFGSVLKWRPHGWLTGKAESGKSWIWENIILPLVGPFALAGSGKSTEAGTRRDLNNDARPALMPEMEPKNEKTAARIAEILELARNSSDDSSGVITMAKPGGGTESFHIRSMFLFNSKAVPEDDASVMGRILLFELRAGVDIDTKRRNSSAIMDTGLLDDPGRFRRRVFHSLKRIIDDIEWIRSSYLGAFGRQRAVDQVAPLIAAAWAVQSSESVRHAGKWLDAVVADLAVESAKHEEDEDALMSVLLAASVRNDEGKSRTVAELLLGGSGYHDNGEGDEGQRRLLERYGIGLRRQFTSDPWELLIAAKSKPMAEFFKGTNFATGYGSYLRRHPLVGSGEKKQRRLAGSTTWVHVIDWEQFRAKYLDDVRDEEGAPF